MAFNRDQNKIRVVTTFGTGSLVGFLTPKVHMHVRHGTELRWIKALDSGNFQVSLALTSGGTIIAKAYPHDLAMDRPTASGWGWPTSSVNEATTAGHSGVFPNGVPNISGTGLVFAGPNAVPYTFTR